MISKFIRNFSLIFFAAISVTSFCIGQNFSDCENISEEKILTMSNEEIMENFMRCRKNNNMLDEISNIIDEKQLAEKLQFIEKDSTFNTIVKKIMPGYIGGSVGLLVFSGALFIYASKYNSHRIKGFSLFLAGGSLSSLALYGKLNQYQNNRIAAHKESRKKIVAKDIKEIFENMKKNRGLILDNMRKNREL